MGISPKVCINSLNHFFGFSPFLLKNIYEILTGNVFIGKQYFASWSRDFGLVYNVIAESNFKPHGSLRSRSQLLGHVTWDESIMASIISPYRRLKPSGPVSSKTNHKSRLIICNTITFYLFYSVYKKVTRFSVLFNEIHQYLIRLNLS